MRKLIALFVLLSTCVALAQGIGGTAGAGGKAGIGGSLGSTPSVTNVSRVDASSCAAVGTSCTPTSIQVGDFLLRSDFRHNSATPPTLASGFTDVASHGNVGSMRVSCMVSTSTTPTINAAANATDSAIIVWRGVNSTASTPNCQQLVVGGFTNGSGSSTSISYAATTFQVTGGNSFAFAFAGHATASNVNTAPTGMTSVVSTGTGPMLAAFATTGAVTTWNVQSVTVNANAGWESYVGEIKASCVTRCANVLIDMNTADANATTITNTIMSNGTQGGTTIGGSWAATTNAGVTIAPSQSPTFNQAVTKPDGTTWAMNAASRAFAVDNTSVVFYAADRSGMTGFRYAVISGYLTVGPPGVDASGPLYDDWHFQGNATGHGCTLQFNAGQLQNPAVYGVNVETNAGGGTLHTAYINGIIQGRTYWASMRCDMWTGSTDLSMYETCSNGGAQLSGSPVTGTAATGEDIGTVGMGQVESSTSPGVKTYYEKMLVDTIWGNFPVGPGC